LSALRTGAKGREPRFRPPLSDVQSAMLTFLDALDTGKSTLADLQH